MSRRAATFLTLLFVTLSAYSQTPGQSRCSLTEANSPSIGSLRLRMTADQLVALFPASTKRKEIRDALEKAKAATTTDPVYLSFDTATDGGRDSFPGVDSVTAGVYRGRVTDFSALYGGTWNSIDEWVIHVSQMLKLPAAKDWTVGPSENPNKVLRCDGIEIEAAIQGGSATVRIHNT